MISLRRLVFVLEYEDSDGSYLRQQVLPPIEETVGFPLSDYLLYDGLADLETVLSDSDWNTARAALSGAIQIEMLTRAQLDAYVKRIDAEFPDIQPPERSWLSVFDAVLAGDSIVKLQDAPLDSVVSPWVLQETTGGRTVPVQAHNKVSSVVIYLR